MTEKFLKAKHWQLFLLTFGIPISLQLVTMVTMIANIGNRNNLHPTFIFKYMGYIEILTLIFMGTFLGWFWSVAIGLQPKVPEGVKMKVNKFKIFFFAPIVYILLFLGFIITPINGNHLNPVLFVVIIPLHLFCMFCMFYNLYFVAKTFKTVELQREVKFSDFAGEFCLIWFFPIGIWIVQPKINKMMEK